MVRPLNGLLNVGLHDGGQLVIAILSLLLLQLVDHTSAQPIRLITLPMQEELTCLQHREELRRNAQFGIEASAIHRSRVETQFDELHSLVPRRVRQRLVRERRELWSDETPLAVKRGGKGNPVGKELFCGGNQRPEHLFRLLQLHGGQKRLCQKPPRFRTSTMATTSCRVRCCSRESSDAYSRSMVR